MSDIQIFNNPEFGEIRTIDQNGEPWFVLKDVCEVFGEQNYRRVSARLDEEEKGVSQIATPGGMQNMTVVSEAGLYSALFAMQPEKARGVDESYITKRQEQLKRFRKWVTSEVLPNIRKHGAYMTPETLQAAILNPDTMIQLCQQLKAEQDKNKALSEENSKLAPKGLFADAVSVSDRCILVSELAKLLKQNGIETGQNRLYERLRADGFLVKDRKRSDFNMPTQKAMELGLFKVRESTRVHSDGHTTIDKTAKVTGKGQIYLINYYLKKQ